MTIGLCQRMALKNRAFVRILSPPAASEIDEGFFYDEVIEELR